MTALSSRALPLARRTSALYCATEGHGTPLLLVHGFGASGASFDQLVPALAKRHMVIVPDLRGHGNSRRLPLADSIGRLAADLDDLLDLLGAGPAFVLGHGGGGAVAQQLAHDRPGRVRGLVLACACACGASRPRPAGIGALRGLAGLLRDRGEHAGACTSAAGDRLLRSFDSRTWLAELNMPTLVVTGGNEAQTPTQQAEELVARLPRARLAIIPGAGHELIQTHAGHLLDLALPWLREQESAA
jgi:3-oxoadipate enol-lactonase